MTLNELYRSTLQLRRGDLQHYQTSADIPMETDIAALKREKNSHRGIASRRSLRELVAHAVNQDFLDEIAQLNGLTYLELGWPITAMDLAPLRALHNLTHLSIDTPRNIADFTPLVDLPKLERLFITNAKHLRDIDWLHPLRDRLVALGIEGSMWTVQRLSTLTPLNNFALEALFLTNTQVDDQDLTPLASMPRLRFLGTAINAPRAQFMALKAARPGLECQWFDESAWGAFKDPKPPKP